MKFLLKVTPRRLQVPPVAAVEAANAWIERELKSGGMDCCYGFVTGGGISISNADTHEAMFQKLMSYPMYPYGDYHVEALCDIGVVFEEIKAMAQRAAAASA
jgi:muconolactone delta-isomerase